jgi:hypothetical protein
MSWNYRVVRYKDGSGYGVHEVYYDGAGKACSMTEQPIPFRGDTLKDIRESLKMANADAKRQPIFDEPENW